MERLAEALQLLREERTQAQEQVTKLEQAIVAIEMIVGKGYFEICRPWTKGQKTDNVCRCPEKDRCGSTCKMGEGQELEACLGYR
jgi:hypothetical protein